MVTRQLRKMWAKLSGSAPETPLILQKVHAALCNPSIACSLSLVSNWLFLSLKMKSFISLCIKDIFHEFRHIRVVSTFGRFVPVILEKVFVILNVFGSADLICELHRTFRNFLDPFLTLSRKSGRLQMIWSVSSSFLKRVRMLIAASCSRIHPAGVSRRPSLASSTRVFTRSSTKRLLNVK